MASTGQPIVSLPATEWLREFGRQIKAARLARRMTQAELAERLGVSRYTVMAIERGDVGVAVGSVIESAAVLGLLGPQQRAVPDPLRFLPSRGRSASVKLDDDF